VHVMSMVDEGETTRRGKREREIPSVKEVNTPNACGRKQTVTV